MWKKYEVKWSFIGRLCGSVPLSEDMIKLWLESRQPSVKPPSFRSMDELAQEAVSMLAVEDVEGDNQDIEKRSTLGFQQIDGEYVMRGGTVKAHLKDCSRILSRLNAKIKGETSLGWRILNGCQVVNAFIAILKNGKPVCKSDGFMDKAVHVITRAGPINALKRIHYVENPTMTFTLAVLESGKKSILQQEDLESILTYGALHGYAGERGDGEGRYEWKIKEVQNV